MYSNKKRRAILLALLAAHCTFYGTNVMAAPVPVTDGKYTADGTDTYDPITHTDTINSIKVSNGAQVSVPAGATTVNGVNSSESLTASSGGQLTVNGSLNATVGLGDTYSTGVGYSGIVANGSGSKIILSGTDNSITSKSTNYKNSESAFFAYNNGEIHVTGDTTTVKVSQSRIVAAQDGASITFSNGKSDDQSALFKAASSSQRWMVVANGTGRINFDRVEIDGTGYSNGRMFLANGDPAKDINEQAKITFLGGSFNRNDGAGRPGATALETGNFGQIEVLGYEGGELDIRTGGNHESGIIAIGGGRIDINSTQSSNFKTTIETSGRNHQHGIVIGTLAATNQAAEKHLGSKYGSSEVNLYGTADIKVDHEKAYGIKIAGDGAGFNMFAVDGQLERSKIHASSTAVKYSSALGNSTDKTGNNMAAGKQIIHLENTDITNDGVASTSDSDGVYTGHLIQIGSHGQEITTDGHQRASNPGGTNYSDIINVADAVKDATLNLVNSTATAHDSSNKDLIHIAGDGAGFNMFAVDGQLERSKIHASSTAVKYSSALGNSTDKTGNNMAAGKQIIHLENTDITNDGVASTSDSDGVYTGHLIQIGSHGQEITTDGHQRASNPGGTNYSDIINVADAVKDATLNLVNSTATAHDSSNKDLIHITYGGQTTTNPDLVASNITVNTSKNTVLNGAIFTDYTIDSTGKSSRLDLALTDNSTWNMTQNASAKNLWQGSEAEGNFVTDLSLNNSVIKFGHLDWNNDNELLEAQKAENFKNLYVAGNYSGDNGQLHMNVVLGKDDSATDKMIVGGDTSGTTYINFKNIGGSGAQTAQGIKVIEVLGNSDGNFIKSNPLVGGLYEYSLVKGGNQGTESDWYLTSYAPTTAPVYRPETGSYLGNMALAGSMFDLRLYDRETHLQHQNNQEDGPNIWIINSYTRTKQDFSNDQIHGNANLYKLRMGTDLYNEVSDKGEQQLFGIMAAYGNGSQTTSASFANRDSKGSVDGFLLGVYGSWFENAHDRSGWYADTWFQYGWFDNEVNGAGLSKESYDTNGWGLSAEIGKSINYKETDRRTYSWQPKLQLTYTKLNNDTYTENNGSTIAFGNEANLQTRLGLRWLSEQNTASTKKDSFFAEVNWLHNSNNYTISSLGDSISQDGNKNLGELRLGYEKEFNKDWFISADLSGRFGSNSYSSFQGMLSLEYLF